MMDWVLHGVVLFTEYCWGAQIDMNEMGEACTTFWGREKCVQVFGRENLRERDHLENPDVDGRIILRWIFRT